MAPHKTKNSANRTLKSIAGCQHRDIIEYILRKADPALVKAICNAAYNVTQGDIPLSREQIQLFFHVSTCAAGINRSRSITSKETENCPEWFSPPDSWSNLTSCNWISYFNRWKCDF